MPPYDCPVVVGYSAGVVRYSSGPASTGHIVHYWLRELELDPFGCLQALVGLPSHCLFLVPQDTAPYGDRIFRMKNRPNSGPRIPPYTFFC
ncbi:hypothetical protein QL285_032763 [Trifolium repens]|nr:hypothetical protein QL285_032763 [Trifolium repens]